MSKINVIILTLLLLFTAAVIHAGSSHSSRSANIITEPEMLRFNMGDPATAQGNDGEWCIIPLTQVARRVKKIDITLDADPGTEIDANLKYADTFVGLANSAVVAAIDTTNGTAAITTFTTATVPASKTLYISFDAGPDAATTQMAGMIYWE